MRQFLLDTHVFLWMLSEPERLGRHRAVLAKRDSELYLSAASIWELAIKAGSGRIRLPEPLSSFVPTRMRSIGAFPIAIDYEDAVGVADLPPHHRDPFDRLIVAQAIRRGLCVVSHDAEILKYRVQKLRV